MTRFLSSSSQIDKTKYLWLVGIGLAVAALDQVIKVYVHTHFTLHESIEVIPGFFNLTYVRNPGAAFGFLADSHPRFREIFFLSMPPIALVVIFFVARSIDKTDRLRIISLALIFGGALGNYIDRLKFRFVVDFLDFHLRSIYHWPAFNTADIGIVTGVMILLLLEFTRRPPAKAQSNPQ